MTRLTLAFFIAALAAPCLHAAPVPVENGKVTTFPYPAKAPVVVCLNGYDKARNRLSAMLKAAMPDDAAKMAKEFDNLLNKFLEGRKLTAIKKDARAFLVLSDLAGILEGNLPPSVLVPITSYNEFRDTFLNKKELESLEKGRDGVDTIKSSITGDETTIYLVNLKEYVALTPDKGVADAYSAKYTPGTTEPMGKAAESFLKADIALYVNMDAINDQFGDQLRGFRGLIDFGLQQAQQQGALPNLSKKQMEALKTVFKGIFQGIEDCRALVLAAEFRPDGLLATLQLRFAEKTASVKLIESEESGPLKDIGKLPRGLNIYSESRSGGTLAKYFRELNQEFSAPDDDEKGADILEKEYKNRIAASLVSEWSGQTINGTVLSVSNYKDPAKALQSYLKSYKAIAAGGHITSVCVKSSPKVTEDAETVRGFKFAEVRIHYDFEATVAGLPDGLRETTLESLKASHAEKTSVWIGTDGKLLIQMAAKDWASAKDSLEKYLEAKEMVGSDQAFQTTRDQLPAEATFLMIAETASTITSIVDSVKGITQALPGGVPLPALGSVKAPKGNPTYVGFAITLKGDIIGVSGYVPTSAMAVGRKMLEGLFKNFE